MAASAMVAADGLTTTVNSGSLIAASGVAVLVGVVGFLSPCVLPLVPGYLSYVAGLAGSTERPTQRRMVAGALLFVTGFTAIFVAGGALFGSLGSSLALHHVALERTFGIVTALMGLAFIGRIPFLQREAKVHRLPRAGLLGAPLLGLTFGLAWSPCLTPTFTAVYALASSQATAGKGALLAALYCLGLGVPFVLVAMGLGWVTGALTFMRKHTRLLSQVGGVVLILFGVLLFSGVWGQWMYRLNAEAASSGFFGFSV
jgi:cytochrome c-type biogenesis protein